MSTARISTKSSRFTQSYGSQDTPPSVLSRIFSFVSFTLEVNQANKIQKENSTFVASNAHGEKYRKPKPTNLKPFRFRTDERRMFKEATLEKKAHAPLK